ncbi:MAG: ABC transporter ATP-binding protein [Ideonella sp.]|nr:ABC transporter ATP-binding protein [Ideonella sp.]
MDTAPTSAQPDDATSVLAVDGLRYRWPGAAADVLDLPELHVAAGDTVFIRGPSGCGKSTLLSLMAGVLVADSGQVSALGQSWAGLSASRRDRHRADHLGYIFQQFNLLPYLSVLDNVRLPCRFSARRAQRAGAGAAESLLRRAGLAQTHWHAPAGQLSIGQQQRVAAARALIGSPELVIADEPTSALDEGLRESFMAMLLGACAESRSALVFVSHDSRLAARFARIIDLPTLNRAASAEIAT